MDVATAWAEMESWLRALAAPMAPVPAADVSAVAPETRSGDAPAPAAAGPATPSPHRGTRAVGLSGPPLTMTAAPGPAVPLGPASPPGPIALTGEWPANVPPTAAPGQAGPAQAARPACGLGSDLVPAGPSAAGREGSAPEWESAPTSAAGRSGGAVAASLPPRPARPAGQDEGPTVPWGPWPSGPDPVAAAVDAALAPLLPPPTVPVPSRTPDAAAPDTVDGSHAYSGNVLVGTHGPDAVADLADLLAGVLEEETRALGVLELEP